MSYNQLGDALEKLAKGVFVILCVSIPLAMWKIIEIAIWVLNHVEISTK